MSTSKIEWRQNEDLKLILTMKGTYMDILGYENWHDYWQ